MAAAAVSIRCLLHALPTINNNKSSNLYPLLSFSAPYLFESRPLSLKSAALTLKSLSSHNSITRLSSCSSSFTLHAETVDDNYEAGGGEYKEEVEEEIELGKSRAVSLWLPGEEAGRLYVGNLPYSMTSSQLADIFDQAGEVKTVEVKFETFCTVGECLLLPLIA